MGLAEQTPYEAQGASGVVADTRHDGRRGLARSDRSQPLHRIDPGQVTRRDIEACVAQRTLERVHRDALARALDGEAVAERVRVHPTTQTASSFELRQLAMWIEVAQW